MKKKNLWSILLLFLLAAASIGISLVFKNQARDIKEYVLDKSIQYPEVEDITSINYENETINLHMSSTENILNIRINDVEYTKEFPSSIKALAHYKYCGTDELFPYIYVLLENNMVYQSPHITLENVKESLIDDYQVIADYSTKKEEIHFINLNSSREFSTCYSANVYVKIGNEVYDFHGNLYQNTIPNRTIIPSKKGDLTYYFDGTISLNDTFIIDSNGNKISFALIGTYENQTYLLNMNKEEYIFKETMEEKIASNPIFVPTNVKKIKNIEKQGNNYTITYVDKTQKIITSFDGENIFSMVPNY